jgi:hypothetical protein
VAVQRADGLVVRFDDPLRPSWEADEAPRRKRSGAIEDDRQQWQRADALAYAAAALAAEARKV